jgi:hypothetical protein
MCSAAVTALVLGALAGALGSLFAHRARTLRVPVPSVWGVLLDGPAGYSPRGIQTRRVALILVAIGLVSFLVFVGLVIAGATCWPAS